MSLSLSIPALLRRSVLVANHRISLIYHPAHNVPSVPQPLWVRKARTEHSRTISNKARPYQADRFSLVHTGGAQSFEQRRKYSKTTTDRSATMSTEESTFKTRDGTSLYTKTWKPSTPTTLHLIFLHGFSDHINAYYNLFPTVSSPPFNITVHGFDQRGWGRSVALATHPKSARGLTGDTNLVMSDIHDFVVHVSKQITDSNSSTSTPTLFLMGHSMGGAEALLYLLTNPSPLYTPPSTIPITDLLLESPHIAFPPTSQPSPLLVMSGRLASKVLPNMQMVQKLDSSAMCRDPKVCKDWDQDILCHDTGTLRGLAGLLDRAGCLDSLGKGHSHSDGHGGKKLGSLDVKGKLGVPVFWAHGTSDHVCDFGESKRCFGAIKGDEAVDGSVFKAYEGGYHKIHAEPDGMGEQFARDVGGWIVKVGGEGNEITTGSVVAGERVSQQEQSHKVRDSTGSGEAVGSEDQDPDNVKSRL